MNTRTTLVLATLCGVLSSGLSAQDLPIVRVVVPPPFSVRATPPATIEGQTPFVTLDALNAARPTIYAWTQLSGPTVPIRDLGYQRATIDLRGLEVAVDTALVFQLELQRGIVLDRATATVVVHPESMQQIGEPFEQIGGSSNAVAHAQLHGMDWAIFNVGNVLAATEVGMTADAVHRIRLDAFIHDVLICTDRNRTFALAATGTNGIAIVDITNPKEMSWLGSVQVDFLQKGLAWTEGGGDILYDQYIEGPSGDIRSLATDGTTLWIGDASYGLHRTALSNVVGATGPVLEPNGSLWVDHEVYALLYAGENPWGAPLDLMVRDNRLFVVHEFLGLAVYDAQTLEAVGRYNLYTDVGMHEDWYLDMDVANEVQPGFLDPIWGMPDYRQASYEILNSRGGGGGGPPIATPWADFDRYGKYYYAARSLDVASLDQPARTTAFVAYGLGGLIAVDVTGYATATPNRPLRTRYLGYAPAVPAHGPDEFIGSHNQNIFPHFGAGMLKESGVMDVHVLGSRVFFSDHFAGLLAIDFADDPGQKWHGARAPYDNDNGIPGDHVPDYEFVTSYDMTPSDPNDRESLPQWMFEAPCLLATGEIGGHGGAFLPMPSPDLFHGGDVDLLMCAGGGGFEFVDIVDLAAPIPADRFAIPVLFPTTDQIGAAPDGTPTETISIGHAQGLVATQDYLYLADGPHGVSAWRITDPLGVPLERPFLVGNTVQDEYPVVIGNQTIYPATHATGVVKHPTTEAILTLCQGVGLRRVDVSGIEAGRGNSGAPLLLAPQPTDIFEHNGAWGKISSTPKQDHAYDVEFDGDLAFVADGGNGLTIYDLTKDPTQVTSGFFVANLGGASQSRPELGRSTGIALWRDPVSGIRYAIMAAGPFGVGVVNVQDATKPQLVKTFEPIKMEGDKVGKADGRCVDVFVHDGHAYFSYDSFGVITYKLADLIVPIPPGIDPTRIWKIQNGTVLYDYRPHSVGEFRLRDDPNLAYLGGGALGLAYTVVEERLDVYVAYGTAGIVKVSWKHPSTPLFAEHVPTVGECSALAIANGRLYAADASGGLVSFK